MGVVCMAFRARAAERYAKETVTGPPRLELGMPVPKTGVLPITPRAKE